MPRYLMFMPINNRPLEVHPYLDSEIRELFDDYDRERLNEGKPVIRETGIWMDMVLATSTAIRSASANDEDRNEFRR
jgi:hypothetical protein